MDAPLGERRGTAREVRVRRRRSTESSLGAVDRGVRGALKLGAGCGRSARFRPHPASRIPHPASPARQPPPPPPPSPPPPPGSQGRPRPPPPSARFRPMGPPPVAGGLE